MKTIYILCFAFLLSACSDFLDTDNLTQKDTSTMPQNESDFKGLTAAGFYWAADCSTNDFWRENIFSLAQFMGDDCLGGGRSSATDGRAIMNFKQTYANMHLGAWKTAFSGIYQANFILENIEKVKWSSEETKNFYIGQAHFLRGMYYFNLARLFGANVPKLTSTNVDKNTPQATPEELYSLIFSDFKAAIESLPVISYPKMSKSENGYATRWAAEAFIARAFLFYTGFYDKTDVTIEDGSKLTKEDVKRYVVDCIENSGHGLVPDYRNLWPYALSNKDYKYSKDNGLEYAGDENEEAVFAIKYSIAGKTWSTNKIVVSYGLSNQTLLPFGKGWEYCTVNPTIWRDWDDNDLRKRASIWNTLDDTTEAVKGFVLNNGNTLQETNYYNKKYMPITVKNSAGVPKNYAHVLYGAVDNFNNNNCQDLVLVRFSDVLLMGAELGCENAQEYLDRVRARVNLPSVPVTLENIKKERRFELAFEGIRYWDLMRWHDVEEAINTNMKDMPVITFGKNVLLTVKFRKETNGFLSIPQSEIELSNGTLKQNPGWDTNDAYYDGE